MRSLNRLTARTVQTLSAEGRYADGGNLYLSIRNGGKSWTFLYRERVTGRAREMGLGPVCTVSLQDARQQALEARRLLLAGKDPLTEKKAKRAEVMKARTFGDFTDEFLKGALPNFKNPKHRYQWAATLTTYAAPLRPMLIRDIATDDVRRVLDPIWTTKHETAKRLRGRIERVLSAAKAAGLRDGENPARWSDNLEPFFRDYKHVVTNLPALPYAEMPPFVTDLRTRKSVSARALEFTILTVARTTETIGATWAEIDFEQRLWIVPAERMKMKRIHRVPLCDRALALLHAIGAGKPTDLIFPGPTRRRRLSDAAMLECLRDLRDGVTVHGFRSSFRDWAGDETTFHDELIELALAHGNEDEVERAYRRGDALKKRRALMDAWSSFISGSAGKVIALPTERAA